MHSPFPGMDPFLEGPQWTSVHAAMSVEIARQLTGRLPGRYVARPSERIVIATPDEDDVAVTTVMPEHIPHMTVEVTDVDNWRVVTAIEVLSPTNKRGDGRQEYLSKRRRTLVSEVHLVEIDLLRGGRRIPMRKALPAYPYFVFVGRAGSRPMMEVWPIRLNEALPSIPIPLLDGDADVALDLQQALTNVYETFRYDRTIDYAAPLRIPLEAADTSWAAERINTWRAERTPGGNGG